MPLTTAPRRATVAPPRVPPSAVRQVPSGARKTRAFQPAVRADESLMRPRARAASAPPKEDVDVVRGGLASEWSPQIARQRRMAGQVMQLEADIALDNYLAFLASTDAQGVDLTVPVYCTVDGALVCRLSRD